MLYKIQDFNNNNVNALFKDINNNKNNNKNYRGVDVRGFGKLLSSEKNCPAF